MHIFSAFTNKFSYKNSIFYELKLSLSEFHAVNTTWGEKKERKGKKIETKENCETELCVISCDVIF